MPVISTNTAANSAIINLNRNSAAQETYLQQLSSGSRINKSSDDAAGLAVSGQLQSDITTLEQSSRNATQAQALLQTADGALSRQADILQRMKSLATQYNSGTVDDESREYINAEYQELIEELDLITTSTEFNGSNLLDGTFDETFIVGIQAEDSISVNLSNIDTSSTGLNLSASLSESDYVVTKATVERTDGEDVTLDTLISELAAADSEVGAGTITFTATDVNGDGDTTDGGDIPAASVTIAATDTIQDVLDGVNGIVDGDGNQLYEATLENGQIVVTLKNADIIDPNSDGVANATTTFGGTAFSSTITNLTADETFDDLRVIDNAISDVSKYRSQIGAYTSAMEYQSENIETQIENLTSAKSSIVDVDIAEAQSNFTNAQVLTEAATAALAQANQLKTSLLTLLR